MKKFKNIFSLYHIFHKRFWKKKGFLVLIALVPLMGLLLGILSGMDSGILTVYLAAEDDDAVSSEIIGSLMEDEGIIRFVGSNSEDAREAVIYGKADAAWIFCADFGERVKKFAERQTANNYLVSVCQREDDITMMLMREKLGGVLYPYVSHEFYLDYVKNEVSSDIDEETLDSYYAAVMPEGSELFEILSEGEQTVAEADYLSAPLRGLLSVFTVFAGLTVSMFFKIDRERELFIKIPDRYMPLFTFGYHFMAIFDFCIVMLLSLAAAGAAANIGREVLLLMLFALSSVLFCMIIERLCFGLGALTALAPLLAIGMLVICPVFWSIGSLEPLAKLFPPYYYLLSSSGGSIADMLIYISAAAFVCFILHVFFPKKRNAP
ncbi:MAG: hypothetical protein IJZ89_04470 [Clostridia bacterium]|nr:hypothetical protein [Clostridia bacterium]